MSTSSPGRVAARLCAAFSCIFFQTNATQAQAPDTPFGHSSSRIILKLTPQANAAVRAAGDPAGQEVLPRLSPSLRQKCQTWRFTGVEPAVATPFGNPALASQLGLDRYYVVNVPVGTDTPAMAADFARLNQDIEEVGLDAIGTVAGLIPSDPSFSRQWPMHNTGVPDTGSPTDTCSDNVVWCPDADIDAPEAWSLFTGSNNVTVAVIDSGVFPHVEFSSRMLTGFNTVNNTTDTSDGCPHGTHVAGIILAGGNNGSTLCPPADGPGGQCGIAGVNWGANLLPVRVLTGCNGTVTDTAEGIIWAADQGARVLNISLQFYNLSAANQTLFQNAVDYAYGLDCVVVAAAGNNNPGVVAYPARLANVLAVSATTACDEIATMASTGWISNYGPEIDLSAPGDDIYSTWTNQTFRCMFGTSFATAHVSGVTSLLRSFNPALFNNEIESVLFASSDDLGTAGWDEFYGFGRVNAHHALQIGNPSCESDADCDDGRFCNGYESCDPQDGCRLGKAPNCSDLIYCTIDACNEELDACTHTPDDAICDDGQFCTGVETCDVIEDCLPGTPPNCNDGIDCTIDGCDEVQNTCTHTPVDAACDDDLFCTGVETCHAIQGCVSGTPPVCDDDIDCTVDLCDVATDACRGIGDHTRCDDGDPCTANVCDGGCIYTQICGACCRAGGGCVELMTESECVDSGPGVFQGMGTNCLGDVDNDGFDDGCPRFIPTVSEWGLVALALLLLCGAKIHTKRLAA